MSDKVIIDLNTIVKQSENLAISELDGDTVVMSPSWTAYYGMDSVARRIWGLIAEPRRVSDLCEQLVTEYAVERQVCEREVCAFLAELNKEALIRIVSSPGR